VSDPDELMLVFLDDQRARVFEIVDGLSEEQWRTPVLPSGWTVLGLVEHLGHAERHWFQQVALGTAEPLPWPPEPWDPEAPFTSERPVEVVLAFYRDTIAASRRTVVAHPLTAWPVGRHGQGEEESVTDLRFIVLHMIEETARHLGHLDAARELLDGRSGLGQDRL
jgi:uncharacterized damage-inducible protein DinB